MKKSLIIGISIITLTLPPIFTPAQGIADESGSTSRLIMNQVLHFGAFPSENMREALGRNTTTLRGNSNGLTILSGGFQALDQDIQDFSEESLSQNEDVKAEVTTQALVYPSPFRQESGAKLGYGLSKDMDITIQFYDMLANKILDKSFKSATPGGKIGYNLVTIDKNDFGTNVNLSAGVYFYLIIFEGKVLAKGKTAIVP